MTDTLHADAKPILGAAIQFHLGKSGAKCMANARCTDITNEGVQVTYKDGQKERIPADTVILAVGMQSTKDTVNSILNCAVDVVPVGDCIQPGSIRQASRTSYFAALDI
jgi:NADH dehydrogenase FAD-containing subunit